MVWNIIWAFVCYFKIFFFSLSFWYKSKNPKSVTFNLHHPLRSPPIRQNFYYVHPQSTLNKFLKELFKYLITHSLLLDWTKTICNYLFKKFFTTFSNIDLGLESIRGRSHVAEKSILYIFLHPPISSWTSWLSMAMVLGSKLTFQDFCSPGFKSSRVVNPSFLRASTKKDCEHYHYTLCGEKVR